MLVIIGEDEKARGEVAVRDLQTRQQESIVRDGAARAIAGKVRLLDS
jgi:histidyl-tRNA synthetase